MIGSGDGPLSAHLRDEILDLVHDEDRSLMWLRSYYAGTFLPEEVAAAVETLALRGQLDLRRDRQGGCLLSEPMGVAGE